MLINSKVVACALGALVLLFSGLVAYKGFILNAPVSDARHLTRRCDPSTALAYRLQYTSRGESYSSSLILDKSALKSIEVKVDAEVLEYCLVRPDGLTLEWRMSKLDSPYFVSGDEPKILLTESLSVPLRIEMDSSGRIQRVVTSQRMPDYARHIVRDLFNHAQWVRPREVATEWKGHEQDITGKYVASYKLDEVEGTTLIEKRRAYDSEAITVSAESATRFVIDRSNGHATNIESELGLDVKFGTQVLGKTRTSYVQKFLRTQAVAPIDADFESGQPKTTLTVRGEESAQSIDRKMDIKALGHESGKSIFKRLATANGEEKNRVFLQLRALARISPEQLDTFKEVLVDTPKDDQAFGLVLGSFVASGSAQAQRVITDAFRDTVSTDDERKMILVAHLGLATAPSKQTAAFIRDVLQNAPSGSRLQDTARLALGNVAQAMEDEHPETFEELFLALKAQLESAPTINEKMRVMAAIANTGHPQTYELAVAFLDHEDASVRRAAVSALRFVNHPGIEPLLLSLLTNEPEAQVRLQAVTDLKFRTYSSRLVELQLRLLTTDLAVGVRVATIENLSRLANAYPQIKQHLVRASEQDVAADVRSYAKNVLARL